MIDKELHKNTAYRIPKLKEQIEEAKDRVGSFIIDCNEPNWDSYDAFPISVETIKFTSKVLDSISDWFGKNIGFLNNRSFKIWVAPNCDGNIHIELNYDDLFECDLFVQDGELVECDFHPMYRFVLDGTKTIADRDFKVAHSGNHIYLKCKIFELHKFLDEAFYKHKWSFE